MISSLSNYKIHQRAADIGWSKMTKLILLVIFGVALALLKDAHATNDFLWAHSHFTANLYQELLKVHSGNFVVSPLSLNIILALVNDGAKGKSSLQLSAALNLPNDKQKVREIFRGLSAKLKGNDKIDFNTANKIYVKDGVAIKDQFKSIAVDVFDADVESIQFTNPSASDYINRWVKEKTNNSIQNVINNDDLSPYTDLILFSVLNFHGYWNKKFNEALTAKLPFHVSRNFKVEVEMMKQFQYHSYYKNSELNAKFLRMDYVDSDISMTIVLPNNRDGLPELESHIYSVLAEQPFENTIVNVLIPKFKMESEVELQPILEALAVVDIFGTNADLSGIAGSPGSLHISKAFQKAVIEVEEKGTKAVAASSVIELHRSSHAYIPYADFIADHPFIYYLKSSAGVLFIGRYVQK